MSAMTAIPTSRPSHGALERARRLATTARTLVAAIGARWGRFLDVTQLGPTAEASTSRHLGGRI